MKTEVRYNVKGEVLVSLDKEEVFLTKQEALELLAQLAKVLAMMD